MGTLSLCFRGEYFYKNVYFPQPLIYKNLDFGMDLDTRVALVGPNGAGKSTLLKLIAGEVSTRGWAQEAPCCPAECCEMSYFAGHDKTCNCAK